jgi:hypothetical protein
VKATVRKNGNVMFTFNVAFHIGDYDLAMFCLQARQTPADVPTRAAVIKEVRGQLRRYGKMGNTPDDVEDEDVAAMVAHIGRLFPELKKMREEAHAHFPDLKAKWLAQERGR